MYCWKCGAENDDGYARCRECLTAAKTPGLLSKLLTLFTRASSEPHVETSEFTTTNVSTHRHVVASAEDLPPEVRAQLEAAIAARGGSHVSETITFTYEDSSGRTRTYHSVEEMPPDVRAVFDRLRREHG